MNSSKTIKAFENKYSGCIAERTLKQYLIVLKEILDNPNKPIKSKSKYLQVKSVLLKCKEVGLDTNNYILAKWTKQSDNDNEIIIDRYISPALLKEILSECPDTSKGNELKLAIRISYYSGIRLSEVLSLKQSNISFDSEKNRIHLNFKGKGQKTRKTRLHISMKDEITNFNQLTIKDWYIKTNIDRISKKLNKTFSFHSLRHSWAINRVKEGVPIHILSKLMGHEKLSTTGIYFKYLDDEHEALNNNGY